VSASKLRLIFAAERLFGERGVKGVSLREIAIAAGNRNNNAVQYHFGSKGGLIEAIMRHRVTQLDGYRESYLQALLASADPPELRPLLDTYFLPHLYLVNATDGYPYAAFMTEYLTRLRPQGVIHVGDQAISESVHLRQIVAHITDRLPGLPAELFWSRFELCHLLFFSTIVRWQHGSHAGDLDRLRVDVDDTLDLMTASMLVPVKRPAGARERGGHEVLYKA
jgi:AcrR family transcriptional regulator